MDNEDPNRVYVCWICEKTLSRKQRLQSHLQSVHDLSCDVKYYKEYQHNPDIPLPRSTLYRKRLQDGNIHQDSLSGDNESICDESGEQHNMPLQSKDVTLSPNTSRQLEGTAPQVSLMDPDVPVEDLDACLTIYSSSSSDNEAFDVEASSSDASSEGEFDDLSSCDIDEDILHRVKKSKVLSSQDESCMAILAYSLNHHLSGQASQDLLLLLKLLRAEPTSTINSMLKMKEVFGIRKADLVDFCEYCCTIFPEDENIVHCINGDCSGLRFKGLLSKQQSRKRKCYFASLPVESQIQSIFETDGMWNALLQYRKKTEMCNNITDITTSKIIQDLRQPGCFLHEIENFSLLFNTDGVPLYKSSSTSIWPVYLVINELPPVLRFARKNMILWGIWQGQGKPVFTTYFQPFIKQMHDLKNEGFLLTLDGRKIRSKGIVIAGTLDLQAKAIVADMSHHNGQYGCISCLEPGQVVKQGRGHARIYPFRDVPPTRRTTKDFLEDAINASSSSKSVRGIKGVSSLLGMAWFDIVDGLVPDYMHGVLMGVTKKMLNLLLSSSNSKKSFFVGQHIKTIDIRLMNMRPSDQIQRLPRKLEKNMHHLKASELQMWLLFYSIPCLTGIMKDEYLHHLALFVDGIYTLLGDNISPDQLQCADENLNLFYQKFSSLYGENNVTLNLHNTSHLSSYVRKLGPLWAWSCFPFEDMNGSMLDHVHGTGDVCQQLLWTIQAQKRLTFDSAFVRNLELQDFVHKMSTSKREVRIKKVTKNCGIAGGLAKCVLNEMEENKIRSNLGLDSFADLGKLSKVLRVVIGQNTFFSEHYTRMTKRIGHIVLTSPDTGLDVVSVQFYVYHHNTDTCYAIVKRMEIDNARPLIHPVAKHLIKIKQQSDDTVFAIPVDKLKEKMIFLTGNDDVCCIARLPNLYGQCS